MSNPQIAVTGAAGYIGSRVVARLKSEHPGWDIDAFDNFYRGRCRSIGDTSVRELDIRNHDRVSDLVSDADLVLHLAAITGVEECDERPQLAHDVNVIATNNIAWICRQQSIPLVFPFSMAVLGDPTEFPITIDHPRNPQNWYGRTKLLGERVVETYADGAFPAHCYLKSNLYGTHIVNGNRISKGTVINFFIDRAVNGETIPVHKPGTQTRNYIHVKDVANAYLRSAENLLHTDQTGATSYEIAGEDVFSVTEIAELVRDNAERELGISPDIELVEHPRNGDTVVDRFEVDTTRTSSELGWEPEHRVEQTIGQQLRETQ